MISSLKLIMQSPKEDNRKKMKIFLWALMPSVIVPECKLVCPTHSEAKQTETLEFGAEKVLLQGHARRQVAQAPQNPELLEGFQHSTETNTSVLM